MKIHVVQKGDTLWEIAKNYGVDFEELKQLNSQISSPDMIMPGMKIKIPSTAKTVKKEIPKKEAPIKEMQQPAVEKPYKDITPKPLPAIKEDDVAPIKDVQPEMPLPQMPQMLMQPMMQMPIMQQNTTVQFPDLPESPEESPVKEQPDKEKMKQPASLQEPTIKQPLTAQPMMPQPSMEQPMMMPSQPEQPMMMPAPPIEQPMVPLCCHVMHPCYPPIPFTMMAPMDQVPMFHPELAGAGMGMPMMQPMDTKDCGCGGGQQMPQPGFMPMDYTQMMPTHTGTTYPPTQPAPTNFPTPPGFQALRDSEEDESSSE